MFNDGRPVPEELLAQTFTENADEYSDAGGVAEVGSKRP